MFKNFMNAIGVEIESKPQAKPIEKPISNNVVYGNPTVPQFTSEVPNVESSKFKSHFDKVFQDNNLPGPDYFELVQARNNLSQYIPDPDSCLKAAFKSLEPSGLTKERIEKGIQHHISVMEKDKETFLSMGEQKYKSEITERHAKIEAEKQEIANIHALLIQKQKEIGERQAKITELEIEKQQAEAKISSQKQGYLIIFEQTLGKFKEDLAKIQTIL